MCSSIWQDYLVDYKEIEREYNILSLLKATKYCNYVLLFKTQNLDLWLYETHNPFDIWPVDVLVCIEGHIGWWLIWRRYKKMTYPKVLKAGK